MTAEAEALERAAGERWKPAEWEDLSPREKQDAVLRANIAGLAESVTEFRHHLHAIGSWLDTASGKDRAATVREVEALLEKVYPTPSPIEAMLAIPAIRAAAYRALKTVPPDPRREARSS